MVSFHLICPPAGRRYGSSDMLQAHRSSLLRLSSMEDQNYTPEFQCSYTIYCQLLRLLKVLFVCCFGRQSVSGLIGLSPSCPRRWSTSLLSPSFWSYCGTQVASRILWFHSDMPLETSRACTLLLFLNGPSTASTVGSYWVTQHPSWGPQDQCVR